MAIDTANKRRSAISSRPLNIHLPIPDGTIDISDRRHSLGFYSGLAGVAAIIIDIPPGAQAKFIGSAPQANLIG